MANTESFKKQIWIPGLSPMALFSVFGVIRDIKCPDHAMTELAFCLNKTDLQEINTHKI